MKKVVQAQKLEEKQIKEALERLRDEQRRLAIAEQSIRDMEGAEEAFIDRLKQAQVDERKAYELLKGVVQDWLPVWRSNVEFVVALSKHWSWSVIDIGVGVGKVGRFPPLLFAYSFYYIYHSYKHK